MGTLTYGGTRFVIYTNDHPPRHVHGFVGEAEIIVDLRADGDVALAQRKDAIRPRNAKRSDVKRVLRSAALHFEELVEMWEEIHGTA